MNIDQVDQPDSNDEDRFGLCYSSLTVIVNGLLQMGAAPDTIAIALQEALVDTVANSLVEMTESEFEEAVDTMLDALHEKLIDTHADVRKEHIQEQLAKTSEG